MPKGRCQHGVLRADRAYPWWHGCQGSDSTCLPAYWVGVFPHLSLQAWLVPFISASIQRTWTRPLFQSTTQLPPLRRFHIELNGATCFSKLDTKDGFWSIHLDEKSSYLTTFSTALMAGTSSYTCPCGLKMSLDVFQMHMDQVMDNLPSTIAIYHDICINSHTPEGHDWHLLKLMQPVA